MQYTTVGGTGMRCSRLALGTMTFGGDADPDTARAILHRALDAGIDHIDTADVYNAGRTEELLGGMLQGIRDELVLATKAYFPTGSGPNDRGSSRRHLTLSLEASLRRLRTDRVELFYLHRFDDAADLEHVLRGLEDLVRQGKALYPAVSNFAAWQVSKALGLQALRQWAPFVAVQPMYNLAKRQAEVELLPMAASERLAVFPYSPVGGGLLSGKYGEDGPKVEGRLDQWQSYGIRYGDPAYRQLATRFRQLSEELSLHPVTLAVAWVASHPAVTAPLLGARSVEQLEPALAALDVPMTPELRARVSALSPTPPPPTDRNEEGKH